MGLPRFLYSMGSGPRAMGDGQAATLAPADGRARTPWPALRPDGVLRPEALVRRFHRFTLMEAAPSHPATPLRARATKSLRALLSQERKGRETQEHRGGNAIPRQGVSVLIPVGLLTAGRRSSQYSNGMQRGVPLRGPRQEDQDISRWLSEATPPVTGTQMPTTPVGVAPNCCSQIRENGQEGCAVPREIEGLSWIQRAGRVRDF